MRRESRHSGRHGRAVDDGEAFFGCRLIGAMPASSRAISALFTLLAPSTSRGPAEAVADDLPSITAPIHASALRSPDAEMLPRTGICGTTSLFKWLSRDCTMSTRMPDAPLERVLRRMIMDARAHDSGVQVSFSGSELFISVRCRRSFRS